MNGSGGKRRPVRRKEAQLQPASDSSDGRPNQTNLSADVTKFSSRPVEQSPWGKMGLAEIQLNGDRHFRPERVPSSRKERPKSARLTNLYYQNLDYVYSIAETLQTLELSNTGLFAFPSELVERLLNIETLILDNNSIQKEGFPLCFKDLVSLKFLSVRNNKLEAIPSCWTFLFQLHTLYADNNQIERLNGLDRLTKLQILSLEGNCISELPKEFYSLKKLEYLNLSHNAITSILSEVKRWINLKELDLSYNNLSFLIVDLFLLPKLEGLQVSHNEVAKIPTVTVKTKDKRRIQSVDLSFNLLTRFPENVFTITQCLDLSSNSIKVINNSAFKKLEWKTTKELFVQDNPINTPPQEVCEAGLKAMLHHYFETKVDSKIYQGIKIFLLGSHSCGKSSLLQTFLDQQPRLTSEEESTVGIDIYDYQIDTNKDIADPRPLSLSLWDCAGSSEFQKYIFPFLHSPSLALILFDLSKYDSANFQEAIGQWMDILTLRNNRAVFILIGTKADLCKKGKAQALLEQAQKDTEEYIKAYVDSIDHEIASIERLDHISAAFNEQYRQYLGLKNFKPLFHPEALITSSSRRVGFARLEHLLVELATQTKTFPSVMRVIPALWGDVESYLDDLGQNQSIVSRSDLEGIIHKLFGLRHLTAQICQYLHESGKAIFHEKEESFKDSVVLRPSSLFEHTRLVFRPDLHAFLTDPSDKDEIKEQFLKRNTEREFDTAVELVTQRGILTQTLIKVLWGTGKKRFGLVNYLCDNLRWCYRIGSIKEKPTDEHHLPEYDLNFDIVTNDDGTVKTDMYKVNILAPALVTCPEPEAAQRQWQKAAFRVTAALRFTRFSPPMFFEKLLVALHTEQLRFSFNWCNGLLAYHTENPSVMLRVSLEDPEDKSYLVYLTCGVASKNSFRQVRSKNQLPNAKASQDAVESGAPLLLEEEEEGNLEQGDEAPSAKRESAEEPGSTDEDDEELTQSAAEFELERMLRQADYIWRCLLPALHEAEKLIKHYPAAWFRREMLCPECKELTFWGEWLSPKEAQEQDFKSCRSCHAEVRTCLLVQPRLKKRQASAASRQARDAAAPAAAGAAGAKTEAAETSAASAANASDADQSKSKLSSRRKSVTFN